MRIKNKIIPSRAASYNWEACLKDISTVGKITPHETEVTLPTNSALIKLATLPKKNSNRGYAGDDV